ncbi:Uncharacterised protein [Bordetella pertussis]|nr:Uncharacterised protein [Bordetella pertussis]
MRPVAEVGKRHHAMARHPRHFAQDVLGTVHGLQGLRQHHGVELLVVEQRQAIFQVLLDDLDAALHAGDHVVVVDLDAGAAHLAMVAQVRQQRAVAAPQVQHARAGLDPAGDARQVGPQGGGFETGRNGAHAEFPSGATAPFRPSSRAIRS